MEMPTKQSIHKILAHSYIVYFILFLIGVVLDLTFRLTIFNNSVMVYIGFALLFMATVLIVWSQVTTRNLNKENLSHNTFRTGPYQFTRTPTHWGLFLLMLGFAFIANAFFVIITTCISLVVTKFIFLEKQEKVLEEKYGTHYAEYKKSVNL